MANKRICIVGDYDSILAFQALGLDIFAISAAEQAEDTLKSAIAKQYPVIFLTENYAEKLSYILDEYRTQPTPAIIPVPSMAGTRGFGMQYVKKAVEQAVGSDIIFNND